MCKKSARHTKKSAKVVWKFRTEGSLYATPSYVKNRVIVPAIDGNIYGLNPKNGKVVWQINDGKPFVADGRVANEMFSIKGGTNVFTK